MTGTQPHTPIRSAYEAHVERHELVHGPDPTAIKLAAEAGYRGELGIHAAYVAAEMLTDPDRPYSLRQAAEALEMPGGADVSYDALARMHSRLADLRPSQVETIANRWSRTWDLDGGRIVLTQTIMLGPDAGWRCHVALHRN